MKMRQNHLSLSVDGPRVRFPANAVPFLVFSGAWNYFFGLIHLESPHKVEEELSSSKHKQTSRLLEPNTSIHGLVVKSIVAKDRTLFNTFDGPRVRFTVNARGPQFFLRSSGYVAFDRAFT
jgi:hypothetical protein